MRTMVIGMSLAFMIGCGSSGPPGPGTGPGPGPGPGPTYVPTAHTFAYAAQQDVRPGDCLAVSGPYVVPADSSMTFSIDDYLGGGSDAMEAGVISDADYQANGGCNFYNALIDDRFTGSRTDSLSAPADTYDLIVGCANNVVDCLFTVTWTATY